MKIIIKHLPCLFAVQVLMSLPCCAGVFNDSIKGFSVGKYFVIEKDPAPYGPGGRITWTVYSPSMQRELNRLNKTPAKRLVFDEDRYIYTLRGPRISVDGNRGNNMKCIIASLPYNRTLGEHPLSPEIMITPGDYAFCEPSGEYDWIVSGTDKLAVVTKPLWFAEPKKDVAEYMTRLEVYQSAQKDERQHLILEDFKRWNDIRGLALLELILEDKGTDVATLAGIINGKSKDFQFEAARVVLKSNLGEKERAAMFDPSRDGGWRSSVERLQQLTKLPILPEDPLMVEANKMLVRFKEQSEK